MQSNKSIIGERIVFFAIILIFFNSIVTSCSGGTGQVNKNTTLPDAVQKSSTPSPNIPPLPTAGVGDIAKVSSTPKLTLSGPVSYPTITITVPQKTSTATKTNISTKTPTRTKVPTKTRVPTRTPKPTAIPPTPVPQDGPVRIFIPASYSKISTPFNLLAAVIPGSGGNVHMQLTGENNRIILEKAWIFQYANGRRTSIDETFDIKISGVAEAARLSIYTLDENGRIIALSSEDILLLSIGETDLAEAQNLMEPFSLRSPYPGNSIHHGIVEIRGIARTRTACTIYMELADQSGKIVGSYVSPNAIQPSLEYQSLNIDLPYQVSQATWVRLIMHQMDIRNGKDVAISSILLKLYP